LFSFKRASGLIVRRDNDEKITKILCPNNGVYACVAIFYNG
jgi:hypothetical protein